MLVISGGVVKSGSVALYQYVREMVQTFGGGFAPMLPEGREDEYFNYHIDEWTDSKWMYVLKLHSWKDELARSRDTGKLKVIMSYRDLRDTCLSVRDFRNDIFEGVIASKILQRIRDAELRWRSEIGNNLIQVPYEFMRLHPVAAIKQIGHFLGIELNDGEAGYIAERWSIHANRARAQKNYPVSHPEFMSPRHISSGNVARWRRELTEEQCRIVQEHVGEQWFLDRGYELV